MKKRLIALALTALMGAFALGFGCKKVPEGEITVYMPDGAPALAFAQMMHEDKEDDGVSYFVVNAQSIASKVTDKNMDDNADFCVLPLTAATANTGTGETYQMVGAVTHGNLYMISKDTSISYTGDNLSSLIGKTVGVLQLNSTPGLIYKSMLSKNNIPFVDLSIENALPSAEKVNLKPIVIPSGTPAGQVLNGMIAQGVNLFVMAEPAVTALQKGGFQTVGNVQTLYGEQGYPQAVLVAKKTLLQENKKWVEEFLEKVEDSASWATSASGETLVNAVQAHMEKNAATSLNAATLNGEVVARCGVRFEAADVCKAKTETFLQVAKGIDSKTVIPSGSFYWLG